MASTCECARCRRLCEPSDGELAVNDPVVRWYCTRCTRRFASPLGKGWKMYRKDPLGAQMMAHESLGAQYEASKHDQSRAHLLIGKVCLEEQQDLVEADGRFCQAVLCDPSYMAARFHHAKIGYQRDDYVCCWERCAAMLAPHYPELFPPEEAMMGSEPPEQEEEAEEAGSLWAAAGGTVTKYHQGALLLLLTLSALMRSPPRSPEELAEGITPWLEGQRSGLQHQFDAELRFATLILRYLPFPPPPAERAAGRPAYVLGDSHTLALAWSRASPSGEGAVFAPRLCVGCKAWHFSPTLQTSRERAVLLAHVRAIPPGSTVVVFAGEIDLRADGRLVHSTLFPRREYKYTSTAAGLQATSRAYVAGLTQLAELGLTVAVVPVRPPPPSADAACRAVCAPAIVVWNLLVEQAVARSSSPNVHFLDCFADMCQSPGEAARICSALRATVLRAGGGGDNVDIDEVGACVASAQEGGAARLLLKHTLDLGDGVHLTRGIVPVIAEALAGTFPPLQC